MTASEHGSPAALDLSPAEEWVLHSAMLGYLEREAANDNPADDALAVLTDLESDDDLSLDDDGLRLVRTVLVEHLADAPIRDRSDCRRVLEGVRAALSESAYSAEG